MKFVLILMITFLFFDFAMSRDFTRHHKIGYSNYIADDTVKISVSWLTLKQTKFIETCKNPPPVQKFW